jgi:hypothetical protein
VTGLDAATLASRLADTVSAAASTVDARPVLARLSLVGTADLPARCSATPTVSPPNAATRRSRPGGELWVESVRVRTQPGAKPGRRGPAGPWCMDRL